MFSVWNLVKVWIDTVRQRGRNTWWYWPVLIIAGTVEDRFFSILNNLIDQHGWTVLSQILSVSTYPWGISFNIFILTVTVILIHAYRDTRRNLSRHPAASLPAKLEEISEEARREFLDSLQSRPTPIRGQTPLSKLTLLPLSEITISKVEKNRDADPTLSIVCENTKSIPIRDFEIWIDKVEIWSENQKSFVSRSDLSSRVRLPAPNVLEPDIPAKTLMLTKSDKGVFIRQRLMGYERELGHRKLTTWGIYRFELLIKGNQRENRHDLFVSLEQDKPPQFIDDPGRLQ